MTKDEIYKLIQDYLNNPLTEFSSKTRATRGRLPPPSFLFSVSSFSLQIFKIILYL